MKRFVLNNITHIGDVWGMPLEIVGNLRHWIDATSVGKKKGISGLGWEGKLPGKREAHMIHDVSGSCRDKAGWVVYAPGGD